MNLKLLDLLRTKYGVADMDFLGNGGFGVVYAGNVNEVPRAIKISRDVLDAQLLAMAEQELNVMKQPAVLDCPSIVQLIGVWRELGHLITVWELCEQSLAKRLTECQRQGRSGLPTDELKRHLREAAVGLDVINGLGVRHRDIKPDNILIVRGRAKIADLGLAVFVGASSLSKTASGTMGYIAPEAYGDEEQRHGRLTGTVDIYALAATAIKLATGRDPFGTNPREIIKNQEAGQPDTTGLTERQTAAALSALHPDPRHRPFTTAAEFVATFFGSAIRPSHTDRYSPLILTQPVKSAKAADMPTELTHPSGIKLKLILPGEFLMGSTPAQVERLVRDMKDFKTEWANDEQPQHPVRITQPFYCGVYPVTQAAWKAVMGKGNNPSKFSGDDQLPVENVSWDMAQEFLVKANALPQASQTGPLRLPTEAEWEYCCRAGMTTIFPWGDDVGGMDDYVWFDGNSDKKTHPVGQKRPNAWGLHDFTGQVWEWCQDVYDAELYGRRSGITVDPLQTSGSDYRVLRGGSWLTRTAGRLRGSPGGRDGNGGFRVVCLGLRTS